MESELVVLGVVVPSSVVVATNKKFYEEKLRWCEKLLFSINVSLNSKVIVTQILVLKGNWTYAFFLVTFSEIWDCTFLLNFV